MAERNVDRLVGQRHGEPEDLVAQRLVIAGEGEDGEAPRRAGLVDQALDVLERSRHRARTRGRSRRRPGEVVHQSHELQLGEELSRARLVDRLALQVLELHWKRQLLVERDELAPSPDGVEAGEQVFPQLRLLHRAGVGEDVLEGAVLFEQAGGGLFADPGYARNVVDLVAREREQVGDLLWGDAPFRFHLFGAVPLLVHGVVAADSVDHELHQVLVARDDHHFPALGARPAGEGGDHVIRFVAGEADGRDAQRLEDAAHQRELGTEVLGRSATGRLVCGVDLAPLRLRLLVECDREVSGAALANGTQEHGGEAVDGIRRHSLPGGEVGQGMVGAEDGVRTVDQPERRHRRPVLTPEPRIRASDRQSRPPKAA